MSRANGAMLDGSRRAVHRLHLVTVVKNGSGHEVCQTVNVLSPSQVRHKILSYHSCAESYCVSSSFRSNALAGAGMINSKPVIAVPLPFRNPLDHVHDQSDQNVVQREWEGEPATLGVPGISTGVRNINPVYSRVRTFPPFHVLICFT